MTQDQQTYSRATAAAMLGLGVQLVFGLIMAGLGLYAQSSALHAAAWHLLGGLPIWLVLWMLYNQHRLERVEALEAEQLSREDARAAALFDEAGQNLASARKKLEGFYKWGLHIVSVVLTVYLLTVGTTLLLGNLGLIDTLDTGRRDYTRLFQANLGNPAVNPWMIVGLTALMAFLGFLTARYVAGMTRVRDWQLLRGGAAYLIGNVLVILLVMVGAVAVALGVLWPLAVLSIFIPGLMILLGIETLLAFVFGIYRPRRQDEVVRPAFDSRLLGWLTSPESLGKIVSETLNYQFGFEITRSWFYVLLGRAMAPLILAGLVILLALSCLVIVEPHQQAVVTDRGRVTGIVGPGISFKMPWPLGHAAKYDTGASRQLVVGTYGDDQRVEGKATLWTNDHVEGKVTYLATAPTPIDDPSLRRSIEESLEASDPDSATGNPDEPAAVNTGTSRLGGLVSMQAVVTYTIGDLATYAAAGSAERPDRLLEAIGERHLSAIVATRSVDDLLGPGRIAAGEELLARVRADVDRYGLGLDVRGVLFHDVHPPKEGEVADAFLEQVNALQTQKTDVENAQREAIGILSAAAGSRSEALRIEAAIARLAELRQRADRGDTPATPDTPEAPAAGGDALQDQITQQQTLVNRLIDDAGGEAARVLADARQDRWETALQEQAEASRFAFEREAYNKAPAYFKSRYYLDAVAEAFARSNRRVISTVPPRAGSTVRLNLEDTASAADLFTTNSD